MFTATFSTLCSDELIRLRAIKPDPQERQHAEKIPPAASQQQQQQPKQQASTTTPAGEPPEEREPEFVEVTTGSDTSNDNEPDRSGGDGAVAAAVADAAEASDPAKDEEQPTPTAEAVADENDPAEEAAETKEDGDGKTGDDNNDDDDSNEAVGKEEAAQNDQDMMNDEAAEQDTPEGENGTAAGKVTVMFQRLLNMGTAGTGPSSGEMVVQLPDGAGGVGGAVVGGNAAGTTPPVAITGPSVHTPTTVRNGRMICNLPDHAVHAGATAIVAVIVGRTLTVANAGDSRAVLCRGGTTYPLSYDHKPLQERELTRIRAAGGFVNHFGRVNGNLNLSRSIGDLKYKQVPDIPPPKQIITAEPDIVQIELVEQDEFLILGCDGIWDCLTNERAVEYVQRRIDTMRPTEIGVQMLNDIISEDPRATQGIGGDNMTIMVIDFMPHKRSYYQNTKSNDKNDSDNKPSSGSTDGGDGPSSPSKL